MLTKRYPICLLLSFLLCQGCAPSLTQADLQGQWQETNKSTQSLLSTLELQADGQFLVKGLLSANVCDRPSKALIDGQGRWELDLASQRILLTVTQMTDPRCAVPFMGNAHLEIGFFTQQIVFYPKGPDNQNSKIIFERSVKP
jgi:hypothetical protein